LPTFFHLFRNASATVVILIIGEDQDDVRAFLGICFDRRRNDQSYQTKKCSEAKFIQHEINRFGF